MFTLLNTGYLRDHPYVTSAKGLRGSRKMASFADVIYDDIVGEWVRKSPKLC